MEKGLKSHHFGHKKKFHSPLGARRPHRTAVLQKFGISLKEPVKGNVKPKHGAKGSKLKFQMGGDSTDPLNLNSLIDRDPSEVTPQVSPLVDRTKELSPQVVLARDVTDPLNLKCNLYQGRKGIVVVTPGKRKRKRKQNDSGCFDDEQENKNKKESDPEKEDLFLPKTKKKKVQKHGKDLKDGKEVKCKEKKKNVKEKHKGEEVLDKANEDEDKTEKVSQDNGQACKDVSEKPELSVKDGKLSPDVTEIVKENHEDVPCLNKGLAEPKIEIKNVDKSYSSKQKHRKTFLYGNYSRYYGYRNPKVPGDSRLKLFHHEWFQDKTVLDIGCNTGNVTLEIAENFIPKHILGIDIDSSLIRTANKHLRCSIQESLSKKLSQSSGFPMSFMIYRGPIVSRTSPAEGRTGYPYNVQFKEENFVLQNDKSLAKQKPTYDVILCLSLTKWIHLNWGDAGLKRSFQRMFLMLKPGGRLLLEAQPFNSYSRRKNLSDKIRRNYDSIEFKPDQFVDYLMSEEVGFASYEVLGVAENTSKGFQRPVYVFTKGVSGESYDALGVNITESRRNMNLEEFNE